jgi:hypothetical protein
MSRTKRLACWTHHQRWNYYSSGVEVFQKLRSQLEVLGFGSVTWSKTDTQNPQVLGDTLSNSVATKTWLQGFIRCCVVEQLYICQRYLYFVTGDGVMFGDILRNSFCSQLDISKRGCNAYQMLLVNCCV